MVRFLHAAMVLFLSFKHTKKAGLHCCCSAFRGSGIAFVSEQATPKPTPICTHTRAPSWHVWWLRIHIPRTSKCCNVLDTCEFTRFRNAKHKARWKPHKTSFIEDPFWRLIMSAITPPKRHNPKAWANYGCKGSELFWIAQEKSDFFAFFTRRTTAEH